MTGAREVPVPQAALLSATEAALEAWVESQPVGYALPAHSAYALLFTLAAHLPGTSTLSGRACRLERLFLPVVSGTQPPELAPSLRIHDGKVHFLSFWQNFSRIFRLTVEHDFELDEASQPVVEVELMRDELLKHLEDNSSINSSHLVEAAEIVMQQSRLPAFWKSILEAAEANGNTSRELAWAEITVLLLTWLHDIVMWEHNPAVNLRSGMISLSHFRKDLRLRLNSGDSIDETLQFPRQTSASASQELGSTCRPQTANPVPWAGLVASQALLLDLEDKWRECGSLDDMRPVSRIAGLSDMGQVSAPLSAMSSAVQSPKAPNSELQALILPPPPPPPPAPPKMDKLTPPAPLGAFPEVLPQEHAVPDGAPPDMHLEDGAEVLYVEEPGRPVSLHIYDVSREASIHRLNAALAHPSMPLKLGGIFHAGVEVDGMEWSYGRWIDAESGSGVIQIQPKTDPGHSFRQTVPLPPMKLSKPEFTQLIAELKLVYLGEDYDLLRRNCCHFADDLCQRIGVGKIPAWVYRLARIGARIDWVLKPAISTMGVASGSAGSGSASESAPVSASAGSESVPMSTSAGSESVLASDSRAPTCAPDHDAGREKCVEPQLDDNDAGYAARAQEQSANDTPPASAQGSMTRSSRPHLATPPTTPQNVSGPLSPLGASVPLTPVGVSAPQSPIDGVNTKTAARIWGAREREGGPASARSPKNETGHLSPSDKRSSSQEPT